MFLWCFAESLWTREHLVLPDLSWQNYIFEHKVLNEKLWGCNLLQLSTTTNNDKKLVAEISDKLPVLTCREFRTEENELKELQNHFACSE